jgi:hypothetical protein
MNAAVVASASDRGGMERLAVKSQSSTTGFLKVEACSSAAFSGRLPSMEAEVDCNLQSNSRWMLWVTISFIAASVVLLASCSVFEPVIDVVPVGSLQEGVVFYLGDIFRSHPEFTVTGLTVEEEQSDGSRRAVWILEGGQRGGQRLRYITYGAKYPDLKESRRASRLRRGKRYEVIVYTSTGGKNVDVFAFRVDENGNVRQVPWLII